MCVCVVVLTFHLIINFIGCPWPHGPTACLPEWTLPGEHLTQFSEVPMPFLKGIQS